MTAAGNDAPPAACTIASNNYLALAAVLADSYREHHPGAEVYCCVVDLPAAAVDYAKLPFRVVFAHELGIPAFRNFAFRYDLLELNTAVKPFLLSHLRDRHGLDRVLYLDPDILVTDTLHGIAAALSSHVAALTPHITAPLDNQYNPSERKIRMVGVYNLGFLGLRLDERTARFLEWWQERLILYGQNDPFDGLFVDQSWMDFAPAFLEPVAILRDPIYNVAYWNLPYRRPRRRDGVWEIAGRRVGFFHLSGISLDDLTTISKHQDRIDLAERPELRPLLEQYRELVMARGHDEYRKVAYGYARFAPAGVPIPPVARRALQRVDPWGRRWVDPFDSNARDSFLHWLTRPLRLPGGRLNRAVLSLWEQRSDLVRRFPQVCGDDCKEYLRWLLRSGGAEQVGLAEPFVKHLAAGRLTAAAAGTQHRPDRHPAEAGGWDRAAEILAGIDLQQPGAMQTWLNEAVPGTAARRPRITNLVMLLYHTRPDVQHSFPDPLGQDQAELADWFCRCGATELGLAAELVSPVLRTLPAATRLRLGLQSMRARPQEPQPSQTAVAQAQPVPGTGSDTAAEIGRESSVAGVNLLRFAETSPLPALLMHGMRQVLETAGEPVAEAALDTDMWGKLVGGRMQQPQGVPYPLTLLCCHASDTMRALSLVPLEASAGAYVVGYWLWDLPSTPADLHHQLGGVNEVWVPGSATVRSLAGVAKLAGIEVRWVPPIVATPRVTPVDRRELGFDDDQVLFFAHCDLAEGVERANPEAALRALLQLASSTDRRAALLLLLEHAGSDRQAEARLRALAGGLPVELLTGAVSNEQRQGLLASCDALLSLHRATAFSLSAAEAMLLGKPVVATADGLSDLLDEDTGFPVGSSPLALDEPYGPYPAGMSWAEPDLDSAVSRMREVVEHPDRARDRAAAGRERALQLHGRTAVQRHLAAELHRIRTVISRTE